MIDPGNEAPDFTLPDQHGDAVSLSGLRGKTVVLYFYPKADTRATENSRVLLPSSDPGDRLPGVTILDQDVDPVTLSNLGHQNVVLCAGR